MKTKLWYEIEVNTARKGAPPNWRELVDEHDDVCRWETEPEVREALRYESRGDNARVMLYADGIGRQLP